ncbi:MAG: hypothetical protein WC839_04270 [Candidatus Paceibacterota bacterium]
MENFKSKIELKGLSKIIKLLTLAVGIGVASNSYAQESIDKSMEQLIKEAKTIELTISDKAKEKGELGTSNNHPSARIIDKLRISEIIYSDAQRTNPVNVLVGGNGIYYFDRGADGELDGVYLDRSETPKEIEEGSMKALIAIESEITQTELDLSEDMDDKFVCLKLGENKVYDTSDQSISNISKEDLNRIKNSLQEKFNEALKSNLENIK